MSDQFLVSTRKGLFQLQRGAKGWKVGRASFLGDNVTLSLHDPRDGTLYAALNHGHFGVKMHRSADGGKSWEECGVPVYPGDPEHKQGQVDYNDNPPKASLKLVWALETGGMDQAGRLWAGTIPGGLFWSDDGATTWNLVESLWDHPSRQKWFGGGMDEPGIHSIAVDPRDPDHLGVGVSCGGYWHSEDGGKTWKCKADGMWAAYMPPEDKGNPEIQDAHQIVQCPGQPDRLWCQHHNGVFKSEDNAESWHEVEVPPSSFGFAVAVHPEEGTTAWTVPAIQDQKRIPVDGKVVVARTRDGGQSFEVLRKGLPQDHAYDLVLRHALDIDETGNRLAIGSTTGGLWVTEDQGDSWERVSAHLPPIYAVRFVQS